jgi:flagellum-specific ATP synthase
MVKRESYMKINKDIRLDPENAEIAVSPKLLGRVLDALGNPVDGKGNIESPLRYPTMANPTDPLGRQK